MSEFRYKDGLDPRKFVHSLPADYEPWGVTNREYGPKGWGADCSCGCRFAAWLDGERGSDWLVCMNPRSHRAGLLTLEHQGCFEFEHEEDFATTSDGAQAVAPKDVSGGSPGGGTVVGTQ